MAKRGGTKAKKPANTRAVDPPVEYASGDDVSGSDAQLSLHSDALDEESDDALAEKTVETQKKRRRVVSSSKRGSQSSKSEHKPAAPRSADPKSKQGAPEKKTPTRKKRKVVVEDTAEDEHDSDIELKDGQEVVGKIIEAPTTGWAPEGQISQHMLDFLMRLRDPACNDRVWFKLHEPVYRRCEKEFKNFVEAFTVMLTEVDPQIPPLPPKDVINRIYRDQRQDTLQDWVICKFFEKRKKRDICFLSYVSVISADVLPHPSLHEIRQIKPGDESTLAAGAWCPAKNELNMIRNHIKHSSDRLREIISVPEFVAHFGEPRPHPKGLRQNVFGGEDELKTAPKGVDKNHEDIDLLKCRSLGVLRTFTDDQVLKGTFIQELGNVARILRPFIHCLNDMMTLPVEGDSSDDAHELD